MALLDMIVTHWNEQWCEGRKFFEMLKLQRGVDWNDVNVILVQDGDEDNTLDLERIARNYPFVRTILHLPHGGVSAARNAGIDASDAKWIMFCDFDDMLYSADSLGRIITSLEQVGDQADMVWGPFWIEMETKDGVWCKTLKERNCIFIHGKCYMREFLIDHGIRFDETLVYSEDSLFNVEVELETNLSRVARMPETIYMWCFRKGSASNYEGGDAKRNLDLYRMRLKRTEAYERRGRKYEARTSAVRMLLDYYWEINGREELAGHGKEEWIRMLQEDVIRKYTDALNEISAEDRAELYRITREEAAHKHYIRKGMPGAEEWLREIGAVK